MKQKKLNIAFFSLVVISTFVLGCSKDPDTSVPSFPVSSPSAQDLGDPGLALVDRYHLGSNLERMANAVAKGTHTYGLVAQIHGVNNASAVVTREIKKLLPTYQERWDKNLANAYSAHFSPAELRSLTQMGAHSPFADKLLTERHAVSQDMQKHSEPLLTELVTKALINAITVR